MKRFFPLVGLTAVLVALFAPANAGAEYITVTLVDPTTITIATDLTGQLTSQFFTVPLIHGYYNDRAPTLVFQGPNVESNDSDGGAGQVPGTPEVGTSFLDQVEPGFADSIDNAINWISPDSTPGNTLYDTFTFKGPGASPDNSFLFTSDNAVPTFGLQGQSICYGDPYPPGTGAPAGGLPVDCPIVPYGTVINAFYDLEGAVNDVPFDEHGAITITFIDDAAAAPEPATCWMMVVSGICGAALLRRRLLDSGNPR